MFKSIKLRFTAVYSLLVIGLVVFLFVAYFFIVSTITASNQIEAEQNVLLSLGDDLSQSISNHKSALVIEAHRIAYDIDRPELIMRNLRLLNESYNFHFENIVFMDKTQDTYTPDPSMVEDDFDQVAMSGPYFEEGTNIPLVMITVAVGDQSEALGHLKAYINLNTLYEEFVILNEIYGNFFLLTNKDGQRIADSEQKIKDISHVNASYSEKYPSKEVIAGSEDDLGVEIYNGDEWFVVSMVLEGTPGWKFSMATRTDNLFDDLADYAGFMAIAGGVILVVTLFITMVLTSNIIKPIVKLTRAAEQQNMVVMTKGIARKKDEICSLYTSFNGMTRALIEHSDKLEELVESRTKDLNEANERLYNLATTDNLTGAMNRMQVIDKIENIMYEIRAFDHVAFSLLFIDLNNFKYYNDTFGHDIGDLLLIEVIDFLKSQIRSNDFLGRYGGDEFIVVYPTMAEAHVHRVVDKLLEAMAVKDGFKAELAEWTEGNVDIPNHKKMGLAIGSATYMSGSKESVDALIKRADKAMYEMKMKSKSNDALL